MSSKRIKVIESIRPSPLTSKIIKNAINRVRGKVQLKFVPEIYTTIVSGINPIRKLIKLAKAEETANTCGGIYIFVKIAPLLAIDSAEANMP